MDILASDGLTRENKAPINAEKFTTKGNRAIPRVFPYIPASRDAGTSTVYISKSVHSTPPDQLGVRTKLKECVNAVCKENFLLPRRHFVVFNLIHRKKKNRAQPIAVPDAQRQLRSY